MPPTPTIALPRPPTVALTTPQSVTVFQSFGISARAAEAAGGTLLTKVVLDQSSDGGITWVTILTDTHPSNPTDTESTSYAFASTGSSILRATVNDQVGSLVRATQTVAVGKASQAPVTISPASAGVTAGQSIAFTALGGSTGNYTWGGAASGSGAAQTVAFPSAGNVTVTVNDSGNANYLPSPPATATITVQPPFNVLTLSASGEGTVAGGGSYPPGAEASAVATADPGNAFTGWTGDASGTSPSMSILMDANKAVTANFAPLLAQTISLMPPAGISTRSPAFAVVATATSGLPVTLSLNSGPATLGGNMVSPTGAQGEVTLTGTQPGNAQYLPAPPVVIAFPIGPLPWGDPLRRQRRHKTLRQDHKGDELHERARSLRNTPMDRTTYPFPLAVNSSHHSHYHRFLLGVDPAVLSPFPKPYCLGALSGELPSLARNLDLPRWRKLYHGALPWRPGFGAGHYALGNVPAYRPLPPEYGRPLRRFGAFDFVQLADPSVSALALVAGDRRVLERFTGLADAFFLSVERGARSQESGPAGSRTTGRLLAGQFAEPNNRWLMPFLHVHTRVLNFTSFREDPGKLTCIDSGSLGSRGQRELQQWPRWQAEALSDLGYRVCLRGEQNPVLRVEGVSGKLLAAMEAPRIAVLRVLERMIVGDGPGSAQRLASALPRARYSGDGRPA